MVAYSKTRWNVHHDVVALAQQQPLQYRACSCFLLYTRSQQHRCYLGHQLNPVTAGHSDRRGHRRQAGRLITGDQSTCECTAMASAIPSVKLPLNKSPFVSIASGVTFLDESGHLARVVLAGSSALNRCAVCCEAVCCPIAASAMVFICFSTSLVAA